MLNTAKTASIVVVAFFFLLFSPSSPSLFLQHKCIRCALRLKSRRADFSLSRYRCAKSSWPLELRNFVGSLRELVAVTGAPRLSFFRERATSPRAALYLISCPTIVRYLSLFAQRSGGGKRTSRRRVNMTTAATVVHKKCILISYLATLHF